MESKSSFLSQLDSFKSKLRHHEQSWRGVVAHVQENFPAKAKELISELECFYWLRKDEICRDFQAAVAGQPKPSQSVYSEPIHDIGAQLTRFRQVLKKVGDRNRRKFVNGSEDIPLTQGEVKRIHDATYAKFSAREKANVRQLEKRHLGTSPATLEKDSVVVKLFFILTHVEKKPLGYTSPGSQSEPYGKHVELFSAVLKWLFPDDQITKDRLIQYLRELRKAIGSSRESKWDRLYFPPELLAIPWLKFSWGSDCDLSSLVKAGVIEKSLAAKLRKKRARNAVVTKKKFGEFSPPKPSISVSVDPEAELKIVRQAQQDANM